MSKTHVTYTLWNKSKPFYDDDDDDKTIAMWQSCKETQN